jgi:hypothetical protein
MSAMTNTKITLLMVNDYPDYIDPKIWSRELSKRIPELEFRLWPHRGDPSDVDIVLIDKGAPPFRGDDAAPRPCLSGSRHRWAASC